MEAATAKSNSPVAEASAGVTPAPDLIAAASQALGWTSPEAVLASTLVVAPAPPPSSRRPARKSARSALARPSRSACRRCARAPSLDRQASFATCPIAQLGFLRVSLSPVYRAVPGDALAALDDLTSRERLAHRYEAK